MVRRATSDNRDPGCPSVDSSSYSRMTALRGFNARHRPSQTAPRKTCEVSRGAPIKQFFAKMKKRAAQRTNQPMIAAAAPLIGIMKSWCHSTLSGATCPQDDKNKLIDDVLKALTKAKRIRMAHGMNRLRALAALKPRAPHTANGSTPDKK